uniref:Uncharacterized protein n=2 Tax=Zea mays TaxID=4577 RepID=A0A804PD36_MAIZE
MQPPRDPITARAIPGVDASSTAVVATAPTEVPLAWPPTSSLSVGARSRPSAPPRRDPPTLLTRAPRPLPSTLTPARRSATSAAYARSVVPPLRPYSSRSSSASSSAFPAMPPRVIAHQRHRVGLTRDRHGSGLGVWFSLQQLEANRKTL